MATDGGLSKVRLERLRNVLGGYVERGYVAGLVALVSRRGETHVETIGLQSRERGEPIRRDTIFRIASMTKPITAVAAMILVEECKLRLDEPIDRLIPELANRRVLKRIDGPLEDTEAARRPITLRDLLTFRMGFGMVMAPPDRYPIQQAITKLELAGLKPRPPHGPDEWIRRLATLPLMHQPGERWMYHTGSDVLGVLIARAAGQPFETFLEERVFGPLAMKDTGHFVPSGKLGRFASCYQANPQTGALELYDDAQDSQWSHPPPFPSGGGGLVSTIDDYLAFGRMMLNKGRVGRERILARRTIEAMVTDYLTPEQKAVSGFFLPAFWDNHGWGLGLSLVTRRVSATIAPGQFGWDGAFGTHWCSDLAEDMVSVLMVQRAPALAPSTLHGDFDMLAYQAIED
ncbi:MAG: serine hydrolase domain-containing protein [Steroidobacteraceae bacterium]